MHVVALHLAPVGPTYLSVASVAYILYAHPFPSTHAAVFPSFADLFRQIQDADREFARQCMSHWLSFIKGPPNKPNKDTFGLQSVSDFLRCVLLCINDIWMCMV